MFQTIAVGPVTFHGYGIIIGLAVMAGWWLAAKLWQQQGQEKTDFDTIGVWVVVSGIVGARGYHVADYWWYYQNHLVQIMALWQGGLAIWGAILGGGLGLLLLSRRKKTPLLLTLDIFAAVLPLSQAIGRWGNWVNYELYGQPTNYWWGWWIPLEYRLEGMEEISRYHPLFLYESVLLLGLFELISYWRKGGRVIGSGKVIGMYLIGYGVIRFLLEPLRLVSWRIDGFPVAQAISLLAILIGFWINTSCRMGLCKKRLNSQNG